MSGRVVTIEWDQVPPAEIRGNGLRRTHWTKIVRAKNAVKESIYWHTRDVNIGTFSRAIITFHFYNPRKVDTDNFAIGMKPVIDQLVEQGVFPDDSPDYVSYGEHTFTKCKQGDEKTIVRITEVTE